jgi:cytochrome c oxidase subunit 2
MPPRRGLLAALAATIAGLTPAAALASNWQLNMPVGVTDISADVYRLHMTILWICVVIGVVVFGAMIYAIVKHRKSVGAEPAKFTHSTRVEIVWTVIPVLILIGMAIPATETLVKMEDTSGSDLTIQVTGYQWLWEYDYLDEDVRFFSRLHHESNEARQLRSGIDPFTVENYLLEVDNRVVVPVDAKVRLLLTAGDVIHAWWVPEFAVKKDAIPGFINEVWFQSNEIGVFYGRCVELCGRDHGFMPIVVEVVSQDDYLDWLAGQRGDMTDRPVAAAAAADL